MFTRLFFLHLWITVFSLRFYLTVGFYSKYIHNMYKYRQYVLFLHCRALVTFYLFYHNLMFAYFHIYTWSRVFQT